MAPVSPASPDSPVLQLSERKRKSARSARRNDVGLFRGFSRWLLHHQISVPFNLIAILCLVHLYIPTARQHTSKFFWVSHYNPSTGQYGVGDGDCYFLAFCIVLFTGLRAGFMNYALDPLAKRWGISKKRDITRFSEQAWLLCYYSIFWTLGVYIYCTSKYFLNMKEMFTDWPTRELPQITKAYILGQWAFWLQQVLVINIEDRRKDHWQMLAHHMVTILLIHTSYSLHLTRVANLILVLMDIVDIFFPLAKCFKYLGFSILRDIMFGVFMVSWFVARHVCYMITLWGIYTYMPATIPVGCYQGSQNNLTGPTPLPEHGWSHTLEPFRNPSGTICHSDNVMWGFLGALGFLQVLTIFWFFLIVQVAIRVVQGIGADDIRSEDDGENTDEEENDSEEVDVSIEPVVSKVWKNRTDLRKTPGSSGVSLPGHRDRKELLSRIGCEKQLE